MSKKDSARLRASSSSRAGQVKLKGENMKLPKTVYVTRDENSDGGEDLLCWRGPFSSNEGEIVGVYKLVSTGEHKAEHKLHPLRPAK